jgi:hypothetical protein
LSDLTVNLKDVFLPEYCVQGERIPFYLIWDKSKNIKISLSLPKGLELKEAYNIDSKDISIDKNIIIANNFEIEGYFGGVIKSKLYADASTSKTITFSIDDGSEHIQNFEKSIELFRPDIKISNNISTINITTSKDKPLTDKQIPLYNYGKGTGIVKIDISEDSEIKEGTPEGFEEFKVKFIQDINESFNELRFKFPQYKEIITNLKLFIDDPLPSESNKLGQLRDTIGELEKAFDNNEEFFEEFAQGIATAYLKNVSVLTDIIAFLAFMKSVSKNRIIFVDAMKVLKVSTTPQKLHATLIVTDLAQNEYPPIQLPVITLTSDKECTIPIYHILNTVEDEI